MSALTVQVVVDAPLKRRLQLLAASHRLSVSSYLRILINQHILQVDRQTPLRPPQPNLSEVYD